MKIAIVSTYTHPTRRRIKEPSPMHSAVPGPIAGLCPPDAGIARDDEEERDVPLGRDGDVAFDSDLPASYEHTRVLAAKRRRRVDAVIAGRPEAMAPALLGDLAGGEARPLSPLRVLA